MRFAPGPPIPALAQTLLYLAKPIEFLEGCHRRYGDTFAINTVIFGQEICVSRPEHIKQVFTGDPDLLRAGEANAALEPVVGARSVLLLDGAEHLRQRRLLLPPFHGDRMLLYAATMREVTEREMASWPSRTPFALHPHMQRITMEVILRTIFGVDDIGELGELRDALTSILDRTASGIAMLATHPKMRFDLGGFSPWAFFKRAMGRVDSLIHASIERRRVERARPGAPPRDDVLSLLLQARDEHGDPMTDGELRDELVTLLAAGHETTATELCWAFDQVLASPRVLAKLRAELEEVTGGAPPKPADLARLEYFDATIKEVLRMRPVIPAVGRRVSRPTTIDGYDVPVGAMIVPAIWTTHQRPDLYPEPTELRPERFLGIKPDPYAWLPFGGGLRRCLGMAFAMVEMKVVLATILARARLTAADPRPARVKLRAFTHAPVGGARVILESRIAPRKTQTLSASVSP